jgi:phosphopantetheinyl transferase
LSSNNAINSFNRELISLQEEIKVDIHLLYYSDFPPEDFFEVLDAGEKIKVQGFGSKKRKREFIAVRILMQEIFGGSTILYSNIGSPYLKNGNYISISHANNVVGIAISESKVGLDLEPVNDKVHRVKHKFLSHTEKEKFNTTNTLDLIRIWSAKEALYKLSGEKGLIFSENLILRGQQSDFIFGNISTEKQNKNVTLKVILIRDFIVSVNVTAI